MADEQTGSSFLRLPAEILYRICDYLDAQTIVYSFGHVCQRFHSIAKTFNQYKISFHSKLILHIC